MAEAQYGPFREAVKRLRDAGRILLGARDALTLPEMPTRVVGVFRANAKGFGFVIPETPNATPEARASKRRRPHIDASAIRTEIHRNTNQAQW